MKAPKTLDISAPRLHSGQSLVYRSPARHKVVACGRRWGKTILGTRTAIETSAQGYPVGWFAPTYKLAAEVYEDIARRCAQVITRASRTEMRISLQTGGVLDFWTLEDTDAGRGRKYKKVIIDEAGLSRNLEQAWNYAIAPTLLDYDGGADFLGTPKGRNYFFHLFNRGLDPLNEEWACWQMPTTSNPKIAGLAEYVEQMRKELPDLAYRQELLAEFVEGAGLVFRGVRNCTTIPPTEPARERRYFMGVDWGQSNDFTALVVIDNTGQVVAVDRFNQIGWEIQRARLRYLAEFWRVESILAELNSIGSPNVEALQAEGLPIEGFTTTSDSKSDLIVALQLAFEQHAIRIPDDPVLIAELESFEASRLPSGKWRYEAAQGHDDTVIGLALAWWLRQHGQGARLTVQAEQKSRWQIGGGGKAGFRKI